MTQIRPLNWLFWMLESLKPILFWLNRSVPAQHAAKFLTYMQEVFNGSALDELQGLNKDLSHGSDHLLRVIANAALENTDGTLRPYDYSSKHMRGACAYFSDYFEKKKGGTQTFSADNPDWMHVTVDNLALTLIKQFNALEPHMPALNKVENAQVRLAVELVEYLLAVRMENTYLDIPESVLSEFKKMLEPYFEKRFGISIPGSTETSDDLGNLEEVQILCQSYWKI